MKYEDIKIDKESAEKLKELAPRFGYETRAELVKSILEWWLFEVKMTDSRWDALMASRKVLNPPRTEKKDGKV
jgi:Holliday junction resolvase